MDIDSDEFLQRRAVTLAQKNSTILEELGGALDKQFTDTISQVAIIMADLNEYPRHIYRYRNSPLLETKLDTLRKYYSDLISKKGLPELLEELKGTAPSIHFFVRGEDPELLIEDLIINDIYCWHPSIDYFIKTNTNFVNNVVSDLSIDKDGLTTIANDFKVEDHGIVYKDKYLIYLHPFLRRFFTSNFVDLPAIFRLAIKDNIRLKVAIDPLRITFPRHLKHIIEADYWYGEFFSIKMLNDVNNYGVTVHARGEQNKEVYDLTFPLSKTVFYTKLYSSNLKEIQIEEIVPTDSRVSSTNKYTLHRFAHAIWDIDKQCFTHLDGSVLIYKNDEHNKRIKYDWKSLDSAYATKSLRKKLFRLDGEIDIKLAKDILNGYFRYNELVEEYLAGKKVS